MILTYQQLLEEQREYYAHRRGQSMPPILPSRRVGPFTDRHQPWCRIFHNPGSTTECWCDSQIAATAYKLGVAKRLECGGKGPCCHVGYPHRHCEHCDVVIDTRPLSWWYPASYPYTVRPPSYGPYWSSTGGMQTSIDVLNQQQQSTPLHALPSASSHNCVDVTP